MMPTIEFVVGGWRVVVSTHGLLLALAAPVGVVLAVARARRPAAMLALAPVLVAAALGGASLLNRALHGGERGGLSSMGGLAAVVAVVLVAARGSWRRAAELADAVAPAGLVALGIGRVGCFLAACCSGRPTDLPWGVVFPELGAAPRHPLQLYSAAFDVALAAALWRVNGPPGAVAARVAVGLGLGRVLLETLRDPSAVDPAIAGVDPATAGAACLLAGGIVTMLCLRRDRRAGPRWR